MARTRRFIAFLLALMIVLPMLAGGSALAETHTPHSRGWHPEHGCGRYGWSTTWGSCQGCNKMCYCWYGICRESGCYEESCFVHNGDCGDSIYTLDEIYFPEKAKKIYVKTVTLEEEGTLTLNLGESLVLHASASPRWLNEPILWTTSSKSVAPVSNGVVTGLKEGTVTITAKTANGKKDTVKIKVIDPYKPSGIRLAEEGTLDLSMYSSLELHSSLEPDTARSALTWTSSSNKIATVDENGVVTPLKEGTVTITVKTYNGKKDTVRIKIFDPYKPSGIRLAEEGTLDLSMYSSLELHSSLEPETARSALTWTSSNKKIASVDENGVITPYKEGTVTITVKTYNGKRDTVKVRIFDPYKPTAINLHQEGTLTLNMGETLTLSSSMQPDTAISELTWTSSNKYIAAVDENGVVSPLKEGTVTITVKTYNGKRDTVKVKIVDPFKPTGIYLMETGTVTVDLGSTLSLNAVLEPASATRSLTWISSSNKIAAVDENGVVTPLKEGTVTITVKTHNGKKDTVKVKVVDPCKPTKITLQQTGTVEIGHGKSLQLNAVLEPATATRSLTWTSSNKAIAAVDENGVVTGMKLGTATITVKTHNGLKTTVKVKVTDNQIDLTPYIMRVSAAEYSHYDEDKVFSTFSPIIKGLRKVKSYSYSDDYVFDYFGYCYMEAEGVRFIAGGSDGGFMLTDNSPYMVCGLYPGMTLQEAQKVINERSDLTSTFTKNWYKAADLGVTVSITSDTWSLCDQIILLYDRDTKIIHRVIFDRLHGH